MEVGPAAGAYDDPPGFSASATTRTGLGPINLLEDNPRFFEHQLSDISQLYAPGLAPEQRCAHLLFQLLNLQAKWRLADAQPFGRAGEIQLLVNRNKIAEMA